VVAPDGSWRAQAPDTGEAFYVYTIDASG